MIVFNEDKTVELKEYDLDKGYLKDDKIITHHEANIIHHEAVKGIKEQGHYETIAEYPNGGKDVKWVVDIEKVEARDAYDEIVKEAYDDIEKIQIYVPYAEEELLEREKIELEAWLSAHDYIGIKIATGRATVEEYAEEIEEMKRKADRINEIDRLLAEDSTID